MTNKIQFTISLTLASLLAWFVSPALPVPVVMISLGSITILLALTERQMRTFSAWRIYGPLLDGGVMLGGVLILAYQLPRLFNSAQLLSARYLIDTNLETFIKPVSVLITLGGAALFIIILAYILRALARACTEGRISHLAYRETVLFAAITLVLGLWEPRGWTALTSLAAIAGYVLPTLPTGKIPSPRQGALWLLMPHVMDRDPDMRSFVRRLSRKVSTHRAVNLVALASETRQFGGEHLDLGFRLGKAKRLFPTLPIHLRDWRTFVPSDAKALSLPLRELYPTPALMPAVLQELIAPEDMVVMVSDTIHTEEDSTTRETLANLPARRSVHINLENHDIQLQAIEEKRVRGHVELTMTSELLRISPLDKILGEHLPFDQNVVTEKSTPTTTLLERWRTFLASFSFSKNWHFVLLLIIVVLIYLAAQQEYVPNSGFANVPAAPLLDIAAVTMMIVIILSWLRSTLSDRQSWTQQILNFAGIRIRAHVFVLLLAACCLAYSMIIDTRGVQEYLPERIALPLSLFLIWKFMPFRNTSSYLAATTSPIALVNYADVNGSKIKWRRVFLFVAAGMGATQLLEIIVTVTEQWSINVIGLENSFFYLQSLTGILMSAITLYAVIFVVLSAVRQRWSPYNPNANRFALACVIGALIAEPIGVVLAQRVPEFVNQLALFGYQLPYIRYLGYFFMLAGAMIAGVLFLQKHGLIDSRIFKFVLWPTVVTVTIIGFLASQTGSIILSQLLPEVLYTGLLEVLIAYLIFLNFIPRLLLRSRQDSTPSDYSTSTKRLGYRVTVALSFILFVLLFAQLTETMGTGYLHLSEFITLSPGRILLTSTLCALLVVRLQHYIPVVRASKSEELDSDLMVQNQGPMRTYV